MKILWLTENYYPNRGGMAQSCDRIIYHLKQKGLIIDIVHFTNRVKNIKLEKQINGNYIACPIEEDISHWLNILSNFLITKMTNKYQFIVAFGGYLPIFSAPVLSKWLNLRLITMIRGNDFDSALFTPKRQEILFRVLENSERITVVDSEKKWKIEKLFPNKTVDFISNGIEIDNWKLTASHILNSRKWKSLNVENTRKVIGLFGYLKRKKGIDFFLEALIKSKKVQHVHLLFIGELADGLIEFLNNEKIHYTTFGFMDKFELLSYYPACDGIAIPSFYDGMPNVLLEAALLGIPIIASDINGISDVLKPNFSKFLFEVRNLESCIVALDNWLTTSIENIDDISQKLKKHIQDNYNEQIENQKYINLFNSMKL